MLKLWAILSGAATGGLVYLGWRVYASYQGLLELNSKASAIQISQIANQCTVELLLVCVGLLAALVLVQAAALLGNAPKS
ncbi:MAG TPA: hypothetical protein DCP69_04235 [Candidatus Omnitrophica bacterium]|nr:hypothetical protein [Candidatus Omnitrophota bacterium]